MTKTRQTLAAIAATAGVFGMGTVLAWSSPAIPELVDDRESKIGLIGTEAKTWISSISALGGLISAPLACQLIFQIGPKTTMLIMSAPFVLGWLLIAYAQDLTMLLIGRFVTGLIGGGFSLAAPIYIGETVDVNLRGILSSCFQLMITSGILFTYVVGALASWQWLSLICGLVPLVFLVAMIFVPETPRFLMLNKRHEDASRSLCWFRATHCASDVEEELAMLEHKIQAEGAIQPQWLELLEKKNFLPMLYMLAIMFFQQVSGINAVIFYTEDIFKDSGSDINERLSTIIVGIVQAISTLCGCYLVHKSKRKPLLIISSVVMCLAMISLGTFFHLRDNEESEGIKWLPLISIMVFICAFSIGFGPLPWTLLIELLPLRTRGKILFIVVLYLDTFLQLVFKSVAVSEFKFEGLIRKTIGSISMLADISQQMREAKTIILLTATVVVTFHWLLVGVITKFFEQIAEEVTIKWGYWSFAIICFVGTLFVLIFLPETKDQTEEDVSKCFHTEKLDEDGQNQSQQFNDEKD